MGIFIEDCPKVERLKRWIEILQARISAIRMRRKFRLYLKSGRILIGHFEDREENIHIPLEGSGVEGVQANLVSISFAIAGKMFGFLRAILRKWSLFDERFTAS